MKKIMVCAIGLILLISSPAWSQIHSDKILNTMSSLSDQYNVAFQYKNTPITVVFVPDNDEPFVKVYDKFKGRKQQDPNMIFVGSFSGLFGGGGDASGMKSHLQQGITSTYGRDSYRILLDVENKVQKLIGINSRAILKLTKGKPAEVTEFKENRKEFLDAVSTYFEK